ncbi:hypothetical protein ACFO1B_12845 [Dactylosporangium siamense]|uniref:Uncharacterized protein n=1 Tax=Dactylosporangium siamense TaxID=685454 RepID=A0A919PT12_9ACTN|nr:hypothetical protein [Dactylosporangium siamense]GIG49172.1 hypothetical protein Dsi01nite_072130 [Dactylosporangium siamense]
MDATITLERHDGGAFQVVAGSDEASDQRHLTFAVPATNDSVRVGWQPGADFTGGGPVEVAVRIGTMPAQDTCIKAGELLVAEPADAPRFGPDANGILDALRDAFGSFLLADQQVVAAPPAVAGGKIGKIGKFGKIGKDLIEDDQNDQAATVAEYAAVGGVIGTLLTGSPGGTAVGTAVGALVGVLVTATE